MMRVLIGRWRDLVNFATKLGFAALFIYVGCLYVNKWDLGLWTQLVLWPIYAGVAYVLVIREAYLVPPPPPPEPEPVGSVTVILRLAHGEHGAADEWERIHRFTGGLDEVVRASGLGVYDGDEFGGGECRLFIYGDDVEALFRLVDPVLRASDLTTGATVEIKPVGADAATRIVAL